MREVISCASGSNIIGVVAGGKLAPLVEISLVVCETKFVPGEKGELVRERLVENVNFSASPETLRDLAKQFTETANNSESEMAAVLKAAK